MKLPIVSKGLGVAVLLGAASAVNAAVIALGPGSLVNPTANALLSPSGALQVAIHDSGPVQAATLEFTTRVYSEVWSGHPDNSLGGYSFFYKFDNVDQTPDGLSLWALSVKLLPSPGVLGVEVDQGTSGVTATFAALGANSPAGSSVFFGWVPPQPDIDEGQSSTWVVVHTAYTQTALRTVGITDGDTLNVAAYIPVPEPTTYAGLFALGLAGFAAYRRFRA